MSESFLKLVKLKNQAFFNIKIKRHYDHDQHYQSIQPRSKTDYSLIQPRINLSSCLLHNSLYPLIENERMNDKFCLVSRVMLWMVCYVQCCIKE